MPTLRGKGGTDLSVRRAPAALLGKVVPELFHAVRYATQIGRRSGRYGVGPVHIVKGGKGMRRITGRSIRLFPRRGSTGNDTNAHVHAIQETSSFGDQNSHVTRRTSRRIVQDQNASVAAKTIVAVFDDDVCRIRSSGSSFRRRYGLVRNVHVGRFAQGIHKWDEPLKVWRGRMGVQMCL